MSRAACVGPGDIAVAADTRDTLGESPWWDAAAGCLWWIDLRRPALHRMAGRAVRTTELPALVGAVVGTWVGASDGASDGGVLLALPDGLYAGDGAHKVAAFPAAGPGIRLNDAKADREGRLWFGAMRDFGADNSGGLWSLEPGGEPRLRHGAVRVPNAIAFSPDGDRLYFADSRAGRIEWATPGPRGPLDWRPFAAADSAPGSPDGATVDAEGFLWNARWDGGCLARFDPDGRLDRIVPLPVTRPSSVAFGGPRLDRLYVTTARQGLSPETLAAEPLAGALLVLEPGVRGLPEPRFGAPNRG